VKFNTNVDSCDPIITNIPILFVVVGWDWCRGADGSDGRDVEESGMVVAVLHMVILVVVDLLVDQLLR
jgi:hypothetical protein